MWLGFLFAVAVPLTTASATLSLRIGTFTSRALLTSEGVYVAEFGTQGGVVSRPRLAVRSQDLSFLAADSLGVRLYAVNSVPEQNGPPDGAVRDYSLHDDGTIRLPNEQTFGGISPLHIVLTPDGANQDWWSSASMPKAVNYMFRDPQWLCRPLADSA
jgi:hypothetical protein